MAYLSDKNELISSTTNTVPVSSGLDCMIKSMDNIFITVKVLFL